MTKKDWIVIFAVIIAVGGYLLIKKDPADLTNKEPATISAPESVVEPENVTEERNSSIGQNGGIKNVVLITLDTIRADHYGFMGYPRNTTPFIDKMASEGTVFKNAHTVVSETGPSISSMFTGLYPFEHHIVNNNIKLDGFHILPEYLKEQGYKTGGFVSAIYLNQITQGFDRLDFEGDAALGPESGARRRAGDKTIVKAKDWLGQNSSENKIFLWVHLFDAHLPFNSDINYTENKNDRLRGDALINFWTEEQGVRLDFFTGNQKESLMKVMDQYDGELQFLDKQLKSLYDFMEQKGFNENTLWVITSDHGEGLGSHSYFDHFTRVYEEQLKTPIIFYNPGVKNGKTINSLVENIDLLPTLADLIGFKIQERVSGQSLIPLISGSKDSIRNYVFSRRGEVVKVGLNEFATKYLPVKNPQDEEFIGELYSLQDENYKLIYSPDNQGRDKFFDLKKDPNELENLIDNPDMRSMAEDMKNKIREILSGNTGAADNAEVQPDKKLEEALRALGY
jgi:arylsulfatase A-like enzyme